MGSGAVVSRSNEKKKFERKSFIQPATVFDNKNDSPWKKKRRKGSRGCAMQYNVMQAMPVEAPSRSALSSEKKGPIRGMGRLPVLPPSDIQRPTIRLNVQYRNARIP
jgi:hypothetical protein